MFSVTQINGRPNSSNKKGYTCDYVSDISSLPTSSKQGSQDSGNNTVNETCSVGSEAFVIEDSSTYILGHDDQWHRKIEAGDVDLGNYLAKDNTDEYVPSDDYNPATKKYVDDSIDDLVSGASAARDTLKELSDAIDENQDVIDVLNAAIGNKADVSHTHSDATTGADGFMSSSDKTKLDGIEENAEVNQNTFSSVKAGSDVINAGGKTAQLEIVGGDGISVSKNTDDKVVIASTATEIESASTTQAGIVKLSNATDSDNETEAATPAAVKAVKDIADSAQSDCDTMKTTLVGKKTAEGGEIFNDYANNQATGTHSVAMGTHTTASGDYSTALGYYATASGTRSFASGAESNASGNSSTAIGMSTVASGRYSFASGNRSEASGSFSTAMGSSAKATGSMCTAIGSSTEAKGINSFAIGAHTAANGRCGTALGEHTISVGLAQHVFGEYNIEDTDNGVAQRSTYVEIVGNGTGDDARSNAYTLDWDGNGVFAGNVTANGNKKLATEEYVTQAIDEASSLNSPALSCDDVRYKGYLTNSYSESDTEAEGVTFADAYFGNMFHEITLPTDGVDFYRFAVDCSTTGLCSFGEITLVASDSTYYQADGSSRYSVNMYVSIDPRSTDGHIELLPGLNLKRTWYPDSYTGESNDILESAAHWSGWEIDTAAIYATKEYVLGIRESLDTEISSLTMRIAALEEALSSNSTTV